MKQVVIIFLILSIFVAIAYFYSERRYVAGFNDGVRSITLDSTITLVDTVEVTDTIEIRYYTVSEAVIDTVNDAVRYLTHLDTTVVVKEDTVMQLNQHISFSEGIFKILSEIETYPVEKWITKTETIYQTQVKEVPADNPFYNTWLAGFASALVIVLTIILLL